MADLFLLQPKSLDDKMPQTLAPSVIRKGRVFSKYFLPHQSSEIGRRLFGDSRSNLMGLGIGTYLAIFHSRG